MKILSSGMVVDVKLNNSHGIFTGRVIEVLWDKVKVCLIAGPDRFNQEVEVNVSNILGMEGHSEKETEHDCKRNI